MARHRRKRKLGSIAQLWLVPLMERYYEPNKPAIVVVGLVLLPFCVRCVLPSLEISKLVIMPLQDSLPELWNIMHSWLTPPMLFLLLNLVIGTIAVTSSRGPKKDQNKKNKKKNKSSNGGTFHWSAFGKYGERFKEYVDEEEEEKEELPVKRTPLVEPSNPLKRAPKTPITPKSLPPDNPYNPYTPVKPHNISPLVEPPKPPLPPFFEPAQDYFSHVSMKTSETPPSIKIFEVPPAEGLTGALENEDNAEIDVPSAAELNAKADDFIQRFKQQLVLQRIQSYRERKKGGK